MSKILDQNGKRPPKKDRHLDHVLFRWIILVLMSVAAKVLNKDEVMNIYVLVGKTAGHSPAVDGFHTQLLQLMEHGEKDNG